VDPSPVEFFFESQSSKKEGRISFQAVFKHDMNSSQSASENLILLSCHLSLPRGIAFDSGFRLGSCLQ
jgi:hypothetical protein